MVSVVWFGISGGIFRPPETLRPQRGQPLTVLVEIDQGQGRQMPVVILHDTAIAHLGITEDSLQDAEGPLYDRLNQCCRK